MASPRTRDKVLELLNDVARKAPIRSDINQRDFDYYTGPPTSPDWNSTHPDNQIFTWQERFHYDWTVRKPPRSTTGCNQFAGQIIRLAGGPYIGGLDLRSSLDAAGAPYAWIPAGSGAMPKTGDVLDFGGEHIGMTYNNPNGSFRHIDGGQGGPGYGYDIIDYGKGPFSAVRGWADVDLLFGSAPTDSSAPAWLAGWWTLNWQGTKYWYYFGKGGFVQYQKVPPANPKAVASQFQKHDAGVFTMKDDDTCTIKWRITGSVEKWTRGASANTMTGLYNNSEALSARKL